MPDEILNPSTLMYNGAEVSDANPLPVTEVAAGSGTSIPLNPRTWLVNGAPISADNPLPVIIV